MSSVSTGSGQYPIEQTLAAIPDCGKIPAGSVAAADFLYKNNLVIELKVIGAKLASIRHEVYDEMLADAGLLSTVRGLTMSQIAARTRRPNFWRKRLEQRLFRPLETHLRKAKRQVRMSREKTGAQFGIIFMVVDGDEAAMPEDLSILTAKMIGRHVERNDPEMAAVSEIFLFHINHGVRAAGSVFDCQVRSIKTREGIAPPEYELLLHSLFDDISRYGPFDWKFQAGSVIS